jgi:hypothetical protein
MKMTKEDIGLFSNNMKATYNESTKPTTQPKPLYGQGHDNLLTVLSYVPPACVDNHYDPSDLVYDLTGAHGWEVVLQEKKEKSSLEEYTLILLRDELRRRGLSYPNMQLEEGGAKATIIGMIEDDIEETGEDVPDWSSRPPVSIHMEPGMEEALRQELEGDIQEAKDKKANKNATPTSETGWSNCKHADMCWQGGECQSEGKCYLFECYYCPYSECGLCTGLSARQSRYVGDFICSACRSVAADNAVVLSASSLE